MLPVVSFFRAGISTLFLLMKEHERVTLENLGFVCACVCKLVVMRLLLNIPSQLPGLNSSCI